VRAPAAVGNGEDIDVSGPLVVNSPDLGVRAAIEGVGIAHSFEIFVAPHLETGWLVSLFDGATMPAHDGFYLYYPSRRQNSAALRADRFSQGQALGR
jgi:DNA-binding transcriptional LysR family regulator